MTITLISRLKTGAPEVVLYVPLLALFAVWANLRVEGDTHALLLGADAARACLSEFKLQCDRPIVHFPIFQFLLAVPMLAAGATPAVAATTLAAISSAFGMLAIAILASVGRRMGGLAGAHLALSLMFSGYGIYYFTTSFNEMAGFALFAAFCAALLTRKSSFVVAMLAFLCCITKEIAAPFVLMVFVVARIASRDSAARVPLWKDLLVGSFPVLVGVALGVLLNSAFNWFRFGIFMNAGTLNPDFRTPPSGVTAYFAYLFLSPAGGLLYVWLSFVAFAAAVHIETRKRDRDHILVVLTLGIVIAANLGLAFWWSSFGWYAWGPRLTLPFLGAATVLLVWCGSGVLTALRRSPWVIPVLALVLFLSMLPNAFAVASADTYFVRMFAPGTMQQLIGPNAGILEKVGPEIIKMSALEGYGRVVILPTTLDLLRSHPWVVAMTFLYTALAALRISRAPRH